MTDATVTAAAERLREAHARLNRVVDGNVGFPECVEAQRAFLLTAFETVPGLLASIPPAAEPAAAVAAGTIDEVIKTAAVALATAAYRIRDIDARETWRDDAMQTIAKALDRNWKAPTVADGDVQQALFDMLGLFTPNGYVINGDSDHWTAVRKTVALARSAYERSCLAELPAPAVDETRPAPEPREPEMLAEMIGMLTRDNVRMRYAGTALAEAALYSVREYDGLHRLALAAAGWTTAVANEGDRGIRHGGGPTPAAPSRLDEGEDPECLAALAAHPLVCEVLDEREDGDGIRVVLHAGARFARRHRSDVDDMNRFETARDALVAVVLASPPKKFKPEVAGLHFVAEAVVEAFTQPATNASSRHKAITALQQVLNAATATTVKAGGA